ncbi:hypothetical protein OXYTRIMIC_189 [Oxytricha trifallax]|uniref:Uncharacterized protein n=1 Tax=Oxytricha trifallax TaxID=1172189 RepID=A0A073ICI5_9SPIT|nr:hypothetical protein OXYTRIMIC_189 [Oxytricha trifallax]
MSSTSPSQTTGSQKALQVSSFNFCCIGIKGQPLYTSINTWAGPSMNDQFFYVFFLLLNYFCFIEAGVTTGLMPSAVIHPVLCDPTELASPLQQHVTLLIGFV